jgi:histidine triad (HIT) family protein
MSTSIFSKIIAREIPADILFEDDAVIAIADIAPKAPVHLLVIPKTEQFQNVAELAAGDPALLAHMIDIAQQLADEKTDGQFRLIFNTGEKAGQTIFHVHAHVLGGELTEETIAF